MGRPRADPTSAAAEFASLGLNGLTVGGKQPVMYGQKQPPAMYGGNDFGPPSAQPNYVSAMRAMPAAGARRGGAINQQVHAPRPF